VQVAFCKQTLKPGFHLIGSRVETGRFQAMGQLHSPCTPPHYGIVPAILVVVHHPSRHDPRHFIRRQVPVDHLTGGENGSQRGVVGVPRDHLRGVGCGYHFSPRTLFCTSPNTALLMTAGMVYVTNLAPGSELATTLPRRSRARPLPCAAAASAAAPRRASPIPAAQTWRPSAR
jgi:hypothetical protein